MTQDLNLKAIQKEWHGTLKSYALGFLASLLLTTLSFLVVITKLFSGKILIYALIVLAIVQAIAQLLFFLHVGQEAKPRWESLIFGFTVLILLIVIIGSLWVMYDLNARMMPEMQTERTND